MNNLYKEILERDMDAIVKSLDDEPSEFKAKMRKGDETPGSEFERAMDMSDDAHHGGDELVGEENDPTKGSDLGKGLDVQNGEPAKGAIEGAENLSSSTFEVGGEFPTSGSSNGMPSESAGSSVKLGDEDEPESQLKNGESMEGADIGQNDRMTRDGGDMSKAYDFGVRERAAVTAGLKKSTDVHVAPQTYRAQSVAAPAAGVQWQVGHVSYSTSEDERIAKSLEENTLIPEPTLNWQAPLTKSRCCGLCKSLVPSFLTICPSCQSGEAPRSEGGIDLSKSVKESITSPGRTDIRFPSDGLVIEE